MHGVDWGCWIDKVELGRETVRQEMRGRVSEGVIKRFMCTYFLNAIQYEWLISAPTRCKQKQTNHLFHVVVLLRQGGNTSEATHLYCTMIVDVAYVGCCGNVNTTIRKPWRQVAPLNIVTISCLMGRAKLSNVHVTSLFQN